MSPLVAADEGTHAADRDPAFSESVYFNFVDGGGRLAGLLRVGNRVNAGHAEVTVLLFLPDGRVAFSYARPPIEEPSFDCGGVEVEFTAPLRAVRVGFRGEVHLLARGTDLEDPSKAFKASPVGELELELELDGRMAPVGWKADDDGSRIGGGAFAANHFEATCAVAGRAAVDGLELAIEGRGVRDHSWGPRVWEGPEFWRWISCLTPAGDGFVAWMLRIGGVKRSWGFLSRGGAVEQLEEIQIESEYDGPARYPQRTTVSFSAGGERFQARGEQVGLVPLRHRREETVARICELLLRFEGFGAGEAHGIAEFQDLMVDGRPAGQGHA
jgi:hypothetical protein